MDNTLDLNKIIISAVEEEMRENEEREKKINAYLQIGDNKQPIYLVLVNKLQNICFDAKRIDTGKGYEDTFIQSLEEFLKIEIEYPREFNAALSKAVTMYLNIAIVNLKKPLNDARIMCLYNAIITIKIFLSFWDFRIEYLGKIETENNDD